MYNISNYYENKVYAMNYVHRHFSDGNANDVLSDYIVLLYYKDCFWSNTKMMTKI